MNNMFIVSTYCTMQHKCQLSSLKIGVCKISLWFFIKRKTLVKSFILKVRVDNNPSQKGNPTLQIPGMFAMYSHVWSIRVFEIKRLHLCLSQNCIFQTKPKAFLRRKIGVFATYCTLQKSLLQGFLIKSGDYYKSHV
jgi:hypothetical protein